MSQTIDHKVVEMKFDNKQFEANARTTMSTLERLKAALKLPDHSKTFENLSEATKKIKLDGIAEGIEKLTKKFGVFGTAARRVVENVTDALMGKLSQAVNYTSDAIVSGGIKRAMNIENAHFQLQALLKDETKVQAIMADAMTSVDGTAYAYDEAAKAASQFAASGLESGEEMLTALKGITGVAAMTNSEYESISNIFTTVAGNGRLMGDQLLQLSARGLNAASTLVDYFKEVQNQSSITESEVRDMVSKGEISFNTFAQAMGWAFGESAERANETFTGAMSNMKSALARIGAEFVSPLIEQNGVLVELFNALRIRINDVKAELTFDEQASAISGLAEASSMSEKKLTKLFNTIDKNGKVSIDNLQKLKKNGVNATGALTKYINGVTNGTIHATYTTKTAINELTNGVEVSKKKVSNFVKNGKIDLAIFTSAMETEFGNQRALSKQFTDFAQDFISEITEAVSQYDITDILSLFYYGVESVKNVLKGLLTVVVPVGKALKDSLSIFGVDTLYSFAEKVVNLTAALRLSEESEKDFYDLTKGLFDVVMLLGKGFVSLLRFISPVVHPIIALGGAMGRLASWVVDVINSFTPLGNAFEFIRKAFAWSMDGITNLIRNGADLASTFVNLEGTQKLVTAIGNAFKRLGNFTAPYLKAFITNVQNLFKAITGIKSFDYKGILDAISNRFSKWADAINSFSVKPVTDAFDKLKERFEGLKGLTISNDSMATFVKNAKQYFSDLREAFTLENLLARMEKIMDVFKKFYEWIKNDLIPAFSDISIGEVVAGASGVGIVAALWKFANGFEKIAGVMESFKKIPDTLGSIKDAISAYQQNLKAESIKNIAIAIAVLAGSLVLLSFADQDNLMSSAVALSIVAGVLTFGFAALLTAINKGRQMNSEAITFAKGLNDAMATISGGVSKALKDLGKAVKIKAIGSAVKDFALSIAIIAGSIIALGWMYREDPEALMTGVELVKEIGTAVAIIMGVMTILGSLFGKGSKSFAMSASGILFLSISLGIAIGALNKLFKMDFPDDWKFKLEVLGGIFVALGILAIALGGAGRLGGDTKLSAGGTILALTIMLIAVVGCLDKLFKMELPKDYGVKLAILAGIFAAMIILMQALGRASQMAGGTIKAAGSILAMSLFIVVIVGALGVLAAIPTKKLLAGAVALGGILLALGVALTGASKISDANTYKSIFAMAVMVGVITAALAVLAIIPIDKLAKAGVALGAMLIALAYDFKEIGKITNNKGALVGVLGMVVMIAEIAAALYVLAQQPWQSLLSAGAALSAVMLSMGECFRMILGKNWGANNVKKIGTFLLMTTALIPVVAAIAILAHQPVAGMLAGALALSGVMLAMGVCFQMILSKNWSANNWKKIGTFGLMCVALLPIAASLALLAQCPWEGLLAGGIALSAVLGIMTGIFVLISKSKPDVASIIAFGAAMTVLSAAVAYELYKLAEQPWQNLLGAAASLSLVLIAMTACLAILSAVHANVATGTSAALALGSFIGVLGGAMVALGALFTEIEPLEGYLDKGIEILIKIGEGLGEFVGAIVKGALTKISEALPVIGINLSAFYISATPFFNGMKSLDNSVFQNIKSLAGALIALTVADLIDGIASFFGADLGALGLELTRFWMNALPFFLGINQLNPGVFEAAAGVADFILALTVADLLTGIKNFLGLDSGTFDQFGQQLEDFGPHLAQFAEDTKDINEESVKSAAAAATMLVELADKLPGDNGIKQLLWGEKNLGLFGNQLNAFGPMLASFAENTKDITEESVQGAANATQILIDLVNTLPDANGLWQEFKGEKSLSSFGQELINFGSFLIGFANQANEVNIGAINGIAGVTNKIIEITNGLNDNEGVISWFSDSSISTFGEELVSFGESMKNMSETVNGVDFDNLNKMCEVLRNFATLEESSISSEFSKSLKTIFEAVANEGLSYKEEDFKTAVKSLVESLCNTITGQKDKFIEAGKASALEYVKNFKVIRPVILMWIKVFVKSITNALDDEIDEFEKAGQNAGKGFIKGLNDTKSSSKSIGSSVANAAVKGAEKALDEHSPSKVMARVGKFAGLGFINAFQKFIAIAYAKGEEFGDSITSGIQIVFDDLNMDPVLTPIVDLSNVRNSTNEIESMFNSAIKMQNLSALSVSSNLRNSSKSNDDLLSAIKDLKSNDSKTGDTYTINGLTYEENANVAEAIKTIVRYANLKRRV